MTELKKTVCCLLLLSVCTFIYSNPQTESVSFNLTFKSTGAFSLSKPLDIPLSILAAQLAVTPKMIELLNKDKIKIPERDNSGNYVILNKTLVNRFDRLIMNPYSKPLDYTATGTEIISLLTPAFLLFTPSSEWLTIGTMYSQVLLFAYGTKELLKLTVKRSRPYMYFTGAPEKALNDGDWCSSFPSGHTTLTFASAAFLSFAFSAYFPESKWTIPVIATSYTLALSTAILRLMSGNHFMTDVLTGAAIGSLCGFAIPFAHYTKKVSDEKLEITTTPLYASVRIKY